MAQKWKYESITEAHERFLTDFLSQHAVPHLAPGTLLQERYQVERVIGIGGMGQVYLTHDLRFKDAAKWHALKEILFEAPDDPTWQTRLGDFEAEATRLSVLNHRFIAKITDWFFGENRAYLVMEYVEGLTLEDILDGTNGFLNEQEVCIWGLQLCDVLTHLHTREPPIILRDLKPSDVMLTMHGEIKLIDFGIGKVLWHKPKMIGHQGYSPPEHYKDESDPRSDIYSLGATLHQLLTKSNPQNEVPFTFYERRPRMYNPNISPQMEAIIMKCLEYQADERWQTAQELRGALRQAFKA
ncbi:MAG TPA: serine/threonine-protein kinase [Ktedonobacterales bacterium]|nr:serine/threonine-protein kinase [Ktedonobacterales bacterium]